MDTHEQRIRVRAYEIWEQDGCPPDRELDCWLQAEREIMAEDEGSIHAVIAETAVIPAKRAAAKAA